MCHRSPTGHLRDSGPTCYITSSARVSAGNLPLQLPSKLFKPECAPLLLLSGVARPLGSVPVGQMDKICIMNEVHWSLPQESQVHGTRRGRSGDFSLGVVAAAGSALNYRIRRVTISIPLLISDNLSIKV
jgi:hypothetical protein